MKKSKYILKNSREFINIKLSQGINLKGKEFLPRDNYKEFSGVSIKKFGNRWFILPKGNALFKTYDGSYKKELKEIRIINELICEALAKQLEMPHTHYELAHYEKNTGLVSYNFLKPNQKLVTLADFLTIDDQLESNLIDTKCALKYYEKMGYDVNIDQILYNIFGILVFDALTLQTDRNNFNINFIIDSTNASITLAPMFDNEFAFNSDWMLEYDSNTTIIKMLKHYSKVAKTLTVQTEKLDSQLTYFRNITSICDMAKCNSQMLNFLQNAIKNINITNAIEEVEDMGIFINDEYKEYLKCIISKTKSLFTQQLKKPNTEETQYIYEELFK